MSDSRLKVGVVGAGGIAAKLHLPEMQTVENTEIAVVSGRRRSRLETICRKFGVPRWTHDYEAVIADDRLDAVIVALPHPLHVEWGLKALQASRHVYMEKPLSTSLEEAERFVQAAEKTDRTVFALPYVERPHLLAAREMVQSGRLGTVSAARCRHSHGGPEVYNAGVVEFFEEQPDDALWFFDAEKADVGAVFDMGVYAIANLLAVCGSVRAVTSRLTTVAKPTQLEDTAAMLLDFESGAVGVAETGWCDAARTSEFSVHGTDGKMSGRVLRGSHAAGKIELVYSRPSSTTDEHAPLIEEPVDLSARPNLNSHQYWIDCIRGGRQPELSNARTARHVTEIMLAALTSSREGRTVEVQSRM